MTRNGPLAWPGGFRTAFHTLPRLFLVAIVVLLCCIGAATQAAQDEPASEEIAPLPDALRYEVALKGVDKESGIGKLLIDVSELIRLKGSPPASLAGLDRRASTDLENFALALRSDGYYGYKLTYTIDEDVDPVLVTLEIETGSVYRLEQYRIDYVGPEPAPPPEIADLGALGLNLDMRARADLIKQAEVKLLRQLADSARPLGKITDSEILVDHAKSTMRVTLTVDPGPVAQFGPTSYEGLADVETEYLARMVPWQEGAPYDQRKVDDYRRRLSETELFESVTVEPATTAGADGSLPMQVSTVESKHRTIGATLSYSTDVGPGTTIFWEHRNAFSEGEKLRLELDLSPVRQAVDALMRKPAFRRIDQALLLQATATHEDDDAFEERSLRFFGGLEREQNQYWTLLGGAELEFAEITDFANGYEKYVVVGLPLGARYDGTDNLLDPTEGSRLYLAGTPTVVTIEEAHSYLALDAIGSTYLSPFEGDRVVFAMRGRLGSIIGTDPNNVPANRRFYSGGGGSVRGYEARSIGPLASNNDPLGGNSVWEIGIEARIKLTDDIGIVPFLDAGQVGRTSTPPFSETPMVAAGIGARYYTSFGPIRFDVAFPLNGRNSDKDFQFYVSIGQAF
ncbi:MAG: autotransporter assembly complex family protein [Dongiaceae bacterium]